MIFNEFYIHLTQIKLILIKHRLQLGIFEENMTDLKVEAKLITIKRRTIINFGGFSKKVA